MHHTYFNGEIKPTSETFMGVNDLGYLRAWGLFDYFRTYNGKPFTFDDNWNRFCNSAKLLGLSHNLQKEEVFKICTKLISMSGEKDCAIRFVLSGGYSENGVSSANTNFMLSSEEIHYSTDAEYERGLHVISYDYVRDLPEIKSTDYKHLMIKQPQIKAAGAHDMIYHQNGEISELSRSNLFVIKGNVIATPDKNILKGITRKVVLEILNNELKGQFKVEERPVTFTETLDADEVFTTSSNKKVMAVTKIDGKNIGSGETLGKLGAKTRLIADAFNTKSGNN